MVRNSHNIHLTEWQRKIVWRATWRLEDRSRITTPHSAACRAGTYCDRREAIGEPPLEHKRILFSICPPLIFFWWRVERLVDSAASMWTLLVLSTWLLCCNCASPRGRPLCILTCWVVQMVIRLCRLRDFRSAFELWYILPSLDEPRCLSMA